MAQPGEELRVEAPQVGLDLDGDSTRSAQAALDVPLDLPPDVTRRAVESAPDPQAKVTRLADNAAVVELDRDPGGPVILAVAGRGGHRAPSRDRVVPGPKPDGERQRYSCRDLPIIRYARA
ncbi:hypothetical protein [Streptomyces sp. NWU339]|uniref:hypothetical protein n=1 Tax=Streptomyces sp. NWU339 TaxID=2185284 RepID=UPI00215A368E|nr:hypothetical protein [Streptomyces sp. NWU339]